MTCDGCGAASVGFALHDYCAECGRNLCGACMETGCCGHKPAKSGEAIDYGEDAVDAERKGPAE